MSGIDLKTYQVKKEAASKKKADRPSVWDREISFGSPFPLKDRQRFYQLLGILLGSGLGVLDCMEVLEDQLSGKRMTALVKDLKTQLTQGKSLSEAMTLNPDFFSPFEQYSIRMGEQTGRMEEVLGRLSAYYEQRLRLKRKLTQALSYPIAVIVVALLVLTFMIAFVVPMFEDVFKRFDADLPPITTAILGFSTFVRENGGLVLLGMGMLVLFILLVRKQPGFRRFWSRILVKIPIMGPLYLKLQIARLCYSFASLLKAKVNLDQALGLLGQTLTFYPLQKAIDEIRTAVIQGSTLHEAVAAQPIFPKFFTQIIKVGEQTAQLDVLVDRLAQTLEEEGQVGVSQLTQFLEPALIIILGVMVATILVAMYLPMFELSNVVSTF